MQLRVLDKVGPEAPVVSDHGEEREGERETHTLTLVFSDSVTTLRRKVREQKGCISPSN